jgi:hypothetical protein
MDDDVFHIETSLWTTNIEQTLKDIGESCAGYKWMNIFAAKKTLKKHNWLMYTSISLGPIAGILSALASKYEGDNRAEALQIFVTIFSFLGGVISAIIKFSKLGEKSSAHKTIASKYASLEGNIRRQLALTRDERVNAGQYLEYISTQFDNLFSSAPLLSDDIYEQWITFAKEHNISIPKDLGKSIPIDSSMQVKQLSSLPNFPKIEINLDKSERAQAVSQKKSPHSNTSSFRSRQSPKGFSDTDSMPLQLVIHSEQNKEKEEKEEKEEKDEKEFNKDTKSARETSRNSAAMLPTFDLNVFSDSQMKYEIQRLFKL